MKAATTFRPIVVSPDYEDDAPFDYHPDVQGWLLPETSRADDQCCFPDVCFVYFFWSCCSWAPTFFSSSSTFFSRSLTSLCTSSNFFARSSLPASTFFLPSRLTCWPLASTFFFAPCLV